MKKTGSDQSGFTLIELLIVVVVLSIIAGIAVPAYTKFISKARDTAVVSFLNKIAKAQEIHRLYDSVDSYTKDFNDLATTGLILSSSVSGGENDELIEHNYKFKVDEKIENGVPTWKVKAKPVDKNPAVKWFYIDQTGIIRYEIGTEAGSSSPPLDI